MPISQVSRFNLPIKNKCCNEMDRISKYGQQHVPYVTVQLCIKLRDVNVCYEEIVINHC